MKNKIIKTVIVAVLVVAVVFGLCVFAESCNVSLYSAPLAVRDESAIKAAKLEVVKDEIWKAYDTNKMPAQAVVDFEAYMVETMRADIENLEDVRNNYVNAVLYNTPNKKSFIENALKGSRTGAGYKMLTFDITKFESILSTFATLNFTEVKVHSRNSLTIAKYAIQAKYTVQYFGEAAVSYDNVLYIKLLGNVAYYDEKVIFYDTTYFEAHRGDPEDGTMKGWDIDANGDRYPVSQKDRDSFAKQLVKYNVYKLIIKEGYESKAISLYDMSSAAVSVLSSDETNPVALVAEKLARIQVYQSVVAYLQYLQDIEGKTDEEKENIKVPKPIPTEDQIADYHPETGTDLDVIERDILDAIFGEANGNGWKLTDADDGTVKSALAKYATIGNIRTRDTEIYAYNSLNKLNYAIKVTYNIEYKDANGTALGENKVEKILVMTLEDNLLRAQNVSMWDVADFDTYKGTTFDGTGEDIYAPIRAFDKDATYVFPNN
ncbi:MAG: hypothetical protein J6Q52_04655 [Clostridia bacterium]|nr:hypothetical protein [Clostridia bacterium]